MAMIRKFGELGMQTPVTVVKQTKTNNALSDDEQLVSETYIQTKGWLLSPPNEQLDARSGQVVIANDYRLYLPVGTDIKVRDQVIVGDQRFIVNDVSDEDTWQAVLHVRIVRLT
jgi:hypothetical protein